LSRSGACVSAPPSNPNLGCLWSKRSLLPRGNGSLRFEQEATEETEASLSVTLFAPVESVAFISFAHASHKCATEVPRRRVCVERQRRTIQSPAWGSAPGFMAPHQNTSAESAIHFRIARPGVISTNGLPALLPRPHRIREAFRAGQRCRRGCLGLRTIRLIEARFQRLR